MSFAFDGVSAELGGRTVVADVTATIASGELVGVLGPNGSGKSSLLRAALGLIAHRGTARIDGVALADLPRAERARRIAYLPQGSTLHWPLGVERVIALGRLPHLAPFSRLSAADTRAIAHAAARAEVSHLLDRTATELSGGERARVMLARALAVEAPVLLVDEPLASLDPAHQLAGMELLRAEARAGGAVVAVLHDLTLAARFCDRVVVMAGGRRVADGAPDAVLTPALLAEVYGVTARFDDGVPVPIARLR